MKRFATIGWFAFSVILFASTTQSSPAQDAPDCHMDSPNFSTRILCIQQHFNYLQEQVDSLNEQLTALTSEDSIRYAAESFITHAPIVAFSGLSCPPGWELFEDAGGRFIVGAGPHPNLSASGTQLSRYDVVRSATDFRYETGGEEWIMLTADNIPQIESHIIGVQSGFSERITDVQPCIGTGCSQIDAITDGSREGQHTDEGFRILSNAGTIPHDNMPPYIALLWCTPENE